METVIYGYDLWIKISVLQLQKLKKKESNYHFLGDASYCERQYFYFLNSEINPNREY